MGGAALLSSSLDQYSYKKGWGINPLSSVGYRSETTDTVTVQLTLSLSISWDSLRSVCVCVCLEGNTGVFMLMCQRQTCASLWLCGSGLWVVTVRRGPGVVAQSGAVLERVIRLSCLHRIPNGQSPHQHNININWKHWGASYFWNWKISRLDYYDYMASLKLKAQLSSRRTNLKEVGWWLHLWCYVFSSL